MHEPPQPNDPNPRPYGSGPHVWGDPNTYPNGQLPFLEGHEINAQQARTHQEYVEERNYHALAEQAYRRQQEMLYRANGVAPARRKSSPVSYRSTSEYRSPVSGSDAAPIVVEYCETPILHHRAVHPKPMNNFMIIAAALFAVELAIAIWQWPMEQWTNNHGLLARILGVIYFVVFMVGGLIAAALTFAGERRINRTRALHTATCKKAFL